MIRSGRGVMVIVATAGAVALMVGAPEPTAIAAALCCALALAAIKWHYLRAAARVLAAGWRRARRLFTRSSASPVAALPRRRRAHGVPAPRLGGRTRREESDDVQTA